MIFFYFCFSFGCKVNVYYNTSMSAALFGGVLTKNKLICLTLLLSCTVYFELHNYASVSRRLNVKRTNRDKNTAAIRGAHPQVAKRRHDQSWKKTNACILILAKNQDFVLLKKSIIAFEAQFNHKYKVPYVILSETPFWTKWKWKLQSFTSSKMEFGLIAQEQWSTPEWIDADRLNLTTDASVKNITKDNRLSYHHMCRFYSGFFFRHELTLKYDYYLRLDSHVDFPCPIGGNPFRSLVKHNKLYGFVITRSETLKYMPTLWPTIRRWLNETGRVATRANQHVAQINSFLNNELDDYEQGECGVGRFQFWSNFEMASFAIFRNETYLSFFDYLDKAGGFYYERWGDAPIHSFYILLMVDLSRVHNFENVGYGHDGCYNWPTDASLRGQCERRYDNNCTFCQAKWKAMNGRLFNSST